MRFSEVTKKYLHPYIGRMSLGVSIKFFGSLMDLLLPWILAYIIDAIIPTKMFPPFSCGVV